MKYYAFDGDVITLIGDFPTISQAMNHEPSGTIWVLSETSLVDLRYQINRLLTREKEQQ